MPNPRRRRALAIAVVSAALVWSASACSTSGATQGGNGYITGKGVVVTVKPGEREAAPEVSGQSLDGTDLSLAEDRGKVVVMNVWASWCGPCRGEADELAAAYRQLPDAAFLGLDTRETDASQPEAFQRSHPVPYQSIYDPDGSVLLEFYGLVTPDSLPSTLVIDQQGEIAAIVTGPVDTTTLVGLVQDVEAEA